MISVLEDSVKGVVKPTAVGGGGGLWDIHWNLTLFRTAVLRSRRKRMLAWFARQQAKQQQIVPRVNGTEAPGLHIHGAGARMTPDVADASPDRDEDLQVLSDAEEDGCRLPRRSDSDDDDGSDDSEDEGETDEDSYYEDEEDSSLDEEEEEDDDDSDGSDGVWDEERLRRELVVRRRSTGQQPALRGVRARVMFSGFPTGGRIARMPPSPTLMGRIRGFAEALRFLSKDGGDGIAAPLTVDAEGRKADPPVVPSNPVLVQGLHGNHPLEQSAEICQRLLQSLSHGHLPSLSQGLRFAPSSPAATNHRELNSPAYPVATDSQPQLMTPIVTPLPALGNPGHPHTIQHYSPPNTPRLSLAVAWSRSLAVQTNVLPMEGAWSPSSPFYIARPPTSTALSVALLRQRLHERMASHVAPHVSSHVASPIELYSLGRSHPSFIGHGGSHTSSLSLRARYENQYQPWSSAGLGHTSSRTLGNIDYARLPLGGSSLQTFNHAPFSPFLGGQALGSPGTWPPYSGRDGPSEGMPAARPVMGLTQGMPPRSVMGPTQGMPLRSVMGPTQGMPLRSVMGLTQGMPHRPVMGPAQVMGMMDPPMDPAVGMSVGIGGLHQGLAGAPLNQHPLPSPPPSHSPFAALMGSLMAANDGNGGGGWGLLQRLQHLHLLQHLQQQQQQQQQQQHLRPGGGDGDVEVLGEVPSPASKLQESLSGTNPYAMGMLLERWMSKLDPRSRMEVAAAWR